MSKGSDFRQLARLATIGGQIVLVQPVEKTVVG
jgi:hypothetical protein